MVAGGRGGARTPDTHPFSTDLDKYHAIVAPGHDGLARRVRLWLLDANLRAVAGYRFDRAARAWHREHRVLGLPPRLLAAVWRRRALLVHHVDIDPRATIGPGLLLMHRSGIVIGPVRIGDNCVLHHNVTIGQRVAAGDQGVPRLGDDVWIGPGATITGAITIGNGVTISAGSVVSRDVPDRSLVAGNPARVIASDYDNSAMLNYRVRRPAPAPDRVTRILEEYEHLRDPDADPQLEAVKAAIFLEDAFGVVLRETDIDPALLGSTDGMRAVLDGAARTA